MKFKGTFEFETKQKYDREDIEKLQQALKDHLALFICDNPYQKDCLKLSLEVTQ